MVTKLSKDTTLAKIIHSDRKRLTRKSVISVLVKNLGNITPQQCCPWPSLLVVPPLLIGGFSYWFYRGLVVLVVSCSCGIALSVPVAVVAAIGNAARHGVLIKGGIYLELAEKLKVIAFDKTGTHNHW